MFLFYFRGVFEARQPVIRKDEKVARARKFEAAIDAAHRDHPELEDAPGKLSQTTLACIYFIALKT